MRIYHDKWKFSFILMVFFPITGEFSIAMVDYRRANHLLYNYSIYIYIYIINYIWACLE